MDSLSDSVAAPAPPESDSDCNSDIDEFFFESDHLAFRGNVDYTSVLRTLAILQTQKIQAANDIEKLAKAEKAALENPEEFIKKLGRGEVDGLPGPITIAEVCFHFTKSRGIYFVKKINSVPSYRKSILKSMALLYRNSLKSHNQTHRMISPFVAECLIKRNRKHSTRYHT